MDPLSEVLLLLKPQSYISRAIQVQGDMAIRFPKHSGIKCYAMLSGQCWLQVEGVADAVLLTAGDCFLLPRGLPFRLATDLSLPPVDIQTFRAQEEEKAAGTVGAEAGEICCIAGGHFVLTGNHADFLLKALPAMVHIRKESDKATLRWSLQRMREELSDPQPGSALLTQQLAYMMLIQALRLHLADAPHADAGWLFALMDQQMNAAITHMHEAPGYPWTLQKLAESAGMSRSVFAEKFKATVGVTAMEYLCRWRMMLAGERLMRSDDSVSAIALSLGYESESAFGKAFRRIMGRSPRQYSRDRPSAVRALNGRGASHDLAPGLASVG